MPISENIPGFWLNQLDKLVNRSDRLSSPDSSYAFKKSNEPIITDSNEGIYPLSPADPDQKFSSNPGFWTQENIDGTKENSRMIRGSVVPTYKEQHRVMRNTDSGTDDNDPSLVDAIINWYRLGGAR